VREWHIPTFKSSDQTCQGYLRNNVLLLQIHHHFIVVDAMFRKHLVKIIGKQFIADQTIALLLERPLNFKYEAGQFVTIRLPQLDSNGPKESTRSMSIASAPHEQGVMISMRLSPSLFKRKIADLNVGDEVEISGPFGRLIVPKEVQGQNLIFLAGGIGIAPFRSIVVDQSHKNWPNKICLFYASRNLECAAFLPELEKIMNPHFKIVPTMSRPEECKQKWHGEEGRITLQLIEKYINGNDGIFYIVGLPDMVKESKKILSEFGVTDDRIKIEFFSGY